ncbi:MAG: hypothetical protein JNK82_16100 [Myxococcaceae bacterium]|nr:hypothetical protein [Myxococcaceae bacterium]
MRLASLALVSSLVACVPSPAEICHRGVDLECTRRFECEPDAVKTSDGFRGAYGTSLEACRPLVAAQAKCDEKVSQDELCTGADTGKAFDLSQASACSSERKAQACADFIDPSKTPASCSLRCR